MGRCEPSTGIRPFTALVDQVMTTEPYASARRVFWVVDNGASHRNWAWCPASLIRSSSWQGFQDLIGGLGLRPPFPGGP
jgi:hypothetical protein